MLRAVIFRKAGMNFKVLEVFNLVVAELGRFEPE